MPAGGNIGQQVADNLFELGKSTAQAVVKTGGDIVNDAFEKLTGAPSGAADPNLKSVDTSKNQSLKDQEALIRKRRDKQRYDQVIAELEQYRQRKQQLDSQIAREKAQQAQEKQQKEAVEKQKKESFVQQLLRRASGASHGETDRQKE